MRHGRQRTHVSASKAIILEKYPVWHGKADSTLNAPQPVPQASIRRVFHRLTSEVDRDPVHWMTYGRQRTHVSASKAIILEKYPVWHGKADSTLSALQPVHQASTRRVFHRLTSEVDRDPVHWMRYGRQRTHVSASKAIILEKYPVWPGKADSTLSALQPVHQASTRRVFHRLTSEVDRDPVHWMRYGRQRTHVSASKAIILEKYPVWHGKADSTLTWDVDRDPVNSVRYGRQLQAYTGAPV